MNELMGILSIGGCFVGIFLVLLFVGVIVIYNSLVQLRQRVRNGWSQIEVQLQKRFDLVPNLVEVVKGYVKHERETFETVTKARTAWAQATSVQDKIEAGNMLTGALKTIMAVAEAYPDLKANQNFLELQKELSVIEEKIAYARQFYNDTVMLYNTKIMQIPYNIIAGIFQFKEEPYYKAEAGTEKAPRVQF